MRAVTLAVLAVLPLLAGTAVAAPVAGGDGPAARKAAATARGPARTRIVRPRSCDRVLVQRRTTHRLLVRSGHRSIGRGVYVRRLANRRIRTICVRRAGTPRWLARPLGGEVRAPARRLRSAHEISNLNFPSTLTGPFTIDLPAGLGRSGWRMLDVPAAPLVRHRNGATYRTASYDVLLEAGYGSVKESIVVHSRQGVRSWRWQLSYTKGRRPSIDAAGRIVYGGKVVLARPVVLDARGRVKLRPRWQLNRNVASFSVNDRRLSLPYVVDPTADFPQRIHPDRATGTRIGGAEDVRDPAASPLGPSSSCTKLPFHSVGQTLWGSMIARDPAFVGAVATATPSGGGNGWALQDGTTFAQGKKIYGIAAPTDDTVFAAGEDGVVVRSTDGGCTWARLATGTTQHLYAIAAPSANVIWIVGENGTVRRSIDGGATFTNANTTGVSVKLLSVDAVDASRAMIGGESAVAARTTDGGATWSSMTGTMAGLGGGVFYSIDMVDANVAWVVADAKIYKTTNGGANWGAFQANLGGNMRSIRAIDANTAWAVGDGGSIYRTTNGTTWVTLASPVSDRLQWVAPVDANVVWAGGAAGRILRSTNGGLSWTIEASPSSTAGSEIFGGAARNASLAWTGDDKARIQRYFPAGGAGSWGWVSEAAGGTTLSAGPWTIGARLCREPYSSNNTDVGFRARVWKVRVNGAGVMTGSTPLTAWSAAAPSASLAGGACASRTVSVTPSVRSMLPTEHFYIEYALVVYGNARPDETITLRVADTDTYVDFSAAALDSTPPPTNLRTTSGIAATGWTNDPTPTFRANLNDPDWYHHNEYQVCSDAACTIVVASGSSPFGQVLGSTNDAWTSTTLADGFYYVRVRTVEDGGESDTSPWTPIDPDPAVNRCSAPNVGPCDKFGLDTALPSAPGPVNDGTAADIEFTPSATTLSANWGAATDGGGISDYEYCISTTITGTSCSGTIVQAWASTGGPGTSVTRTGLSLVNAQAYFTCVRAIDMVGNVGPSVCSNAQTVDTAAPPQPAAVRDGAGPDLAYTPTATQLEANWDAVADAPGGSGLSRYDACFSTSATGVDCAAGAVSPWASTGTTTNATRTGLSLTHGTTYFSCVRATDNVGNVGSVRCSDGITVDTGAPTTSWTSWTENSAFLYSPGGADADLLWYNPLAPLAGSGTATATVTATDGFSGMQRVDFPGLAAMGWGAGGSDTSVGPADTWSWGYSFTGGGAIADPAPNNAIAVDKAGNQTTPPALAFRIDPDGAGAVVPPMASMDGLQSSNLYTQSFPLGNDTQSGIARYVIDARFAPMADGVCGAWDPWDNGTGLPGRSGAATNGTVLSITWRMNDMNADGILDLHDAFCFQSRVRVFDNVQNLSTIDPVGVRRFDLADPAVSFSAPPDGSAQAGTFAITGRTTDLHVQDAPGEYPDTGSGIDRVQVTYELPDGPDADALPDASGAACAPVTTFTGTWDNLGWSCSWNTSALPDGLYTVRAQATDRSGRTSTIATRTFLIDNQPPVLAWHSWNDNASAFMHSAGTVAWVNPNAPAGAYQLDARVTAYDLGSGVNRVEFPAMGAGWSPTGTSAATFTSPTPAPNGYTRSFTFTNPATLAAPGAKLATAFDGANNPSTTGYEVRLDGDAPTGMDAAVVTGQQKSTTVTVSLTPGNDGALGSGAAGWELLYQTAPMTNNTCGAWGSGTSLTSGAGAPPASWTHDVSALGSQCYRYVLRVTDNVGNVGTSVPTTERRVDMSVPVTTITSPTTGAQLRGTFSVDGTATDMHTGIEHVELAWTGPGATSGSICNPATLGGGSPTWTFTCSWNTSALPDGTYTILATSYDNVGNVSAVDSVSVLLDNQPPVIAWHSWNDNGSAFMHSVGTVAWVNPTAPAGAYQLDARVTATDLGSGVARVEFPPMGAGWSPTATSNATFTSPTPVPNAYTQAFTFANPGAIALPGSKLATAVDGAGNPATTGYEVRFDSAAPTGMDATVVDGRQADANVSVTLTGGVEGALESGLASWALEYQTAPLANDACGAWSGTWGAVAGAAGLPPATQVHDVSTLGSQCYRYRLLVTDNVGNVGTSPLPTASRRVDLVVPTVAITSPATGSSQSGTFTVAGTAGDAHTGVDRVRLTWSGPEAPGSGVVCDPATLAGASPAWTWSCPWNTLALDDGWYTVTATSYDRAGNPSATHSISLLLDNQPPVVAWHSWNDYGATYLHHAGTVAWANPNAPAGAYQLDARVTATDLGSGVDRVEFPSLGAGWSPGATTNATFTSPTPAPDAYTMTYSFTNPATIAPAPAPMATAYDGAGNPSTVGFEVRLDGNAPSGMGATIVNGRQNSPSVVVGIVAGDDEVGGSGVASWTLQYDTAPLVNDACGAWLGAWNEVTSWASPPPATYTHDVTALGSRCYRYRMQVADNVSNTGNSTPLNARRVDLTPPTVAITAPATGTSHSGTVTVSGDAGDAHTGVDHVRLTWDGPEAPGSGVVCDPATLGGASPTWTWSCAWNTLTLDDGTYTLTATSYDRAGNASDTHSITVLLDNQPPVLAWHSWNDYGDLFTHAVGNVAWINPAAPDGTRTLDARVAATDAGSGVDRVEFPALGGGWTPLALTNATNTSPTPVANAYTMSYSWTLPGAVAAPGVQLARAVDGASNASTTPFEVRHDTQGPAGGKISYANGYVPSTSVKVTFDTGTDAAGESGFRGWRLLRSDGTLSGGSCSAWSAYSTVVATGVSATPTGSVTDTVTDPGCFRYQLVVVDNVGNETPVTGVQEVKVDLTPPTGTLNIAEGTNPAWQYRASANRIYVNTSPGRSGTFDIDVTANAASGILDATFPVLAAGFTGDGVMPGPGPFTRTYSWSAGATNPAPGKVVGVRSNSLGQLNLPFEVIADATPPSGAAVSYTSGYTTGSSVTVTYTTGNDGTGSGMAGYQLEREQGTLAGGLCTWSGTWTPAGPASGPLTYTDATLAHGSCYRFRVGATDNVGNVSTPAGGPAIKVDTTAPTASMEWVENATGTGTYTSGDTIWYQPGLGTFAAREQFSMRVRIVDPESGPGTVSFPGAFAGNWALGPITTNADGAQRRYDRWNYANEPGTVTAIAANGSGLTTTVTGNVLIDNGVSSLPAWSIDYSHGFDIDNSVDISWVSATTDDRSGYAKADLVRRSWPFVPMDGRCDHTAVPTDTLMGPATGTTYTDLSVVQPVCYRYFIRVYDRAENVGLVWASTGGSSPQLFDSAWPTWDYRTVAEVDDIFPPAAFSLNLPTNPALPAITTGAASPSCTAVPTWDGATPAMSWTASSDAESGLYGYRVYLDGTGTVDATVVAPATSWTSGTAIPDGAHTLGVRAVDNQGNVRAADPGFPTDVRIDSSAPAAAIVSPNGGWTLDTTPTLDWTAADANCLARVEVYLDDMATPVAVLSGAEASEWTPPAPISSGSHQWKVVAIDSLDKRTTAGPVTFGVDVVPPAPFALTAPTAGQTVRGFVNVAWNATTDAESGMSALAAYEVWVDGTLRTTVGSGTTTATISSITAGSHTVFVRARDLVGNSRDTATVSFTGYAAIPAPVLVSPANASHRNTVPVLDWNWPSDGGPPPTKYDIVLDGVTVGTEVHPTTAHAIADPGDGTHSWRIIQTDPYTGVVTSATWSFNLDRTPPTNPGPLSRTGTVVSWPLPVDPAAPTASGIATQTFVIEDSAGTVLYSIAKPAAGTSHDYSTQALGDGTYRMYVVATDRAGNASQTPALTVVNDSVPPTAFSLDAPPPTPALPAITTGSPAPACGSAPTYVTAMPTLSWQASSDATSGLAGYDVYIDGLMVGSVGAATTSYTVGSPLTGGAHSWRVVARDNFGLSRTSTPSPMNVRVDGASPSIMHGSPAAGGFTADTTPSLSWAGTDDNCVARVEVTLDGAVVAVAAGNEGSWTPGTALVEGAHTWSLRAFDSAGNVTATAAPRTFTVDTTAPTAVSAIFPANGGTEPEGMMTFSWSAGSDGTGSGVAKYDITIDGVAVAGNLASTTYGPHAIYAGSHTWSIRAYDAVGNSSLFSFSFTASVVPDITPPSAFNLLTPADNAPVAAGFSLTWEPAWDFKGVTQYRVFIDGSLVGTTNGSTTSFTPLVGAGAAICEIGYDPALDAGCLTGPTYANGEVANAATTPASPASSDWNSASYAGWVSSGSAHGFGDPTVAPSTTAGTGFDGDRMWSALEYSASIPAGGADMRFEHRYLAHMVGQSAYDGMTVELLVDDEGDGFGNDVWEATCTYGARAVYGTTLNCKHEVVEVDGGMNVAFGGPSSNHPLAYQNGYSGDSGGMVQTKMRMSAFAGMNVRVRFRVGTDGCYSGMPAAKAAYCPAGWHRAVWRIDNVALTAPDLLPGPHTWYVQARDAAGNVRASNQTWGFNLS